MFILFLSSESLVMVPRGLVYDEASLHEIADIMERKSPTYPVMAIQGTMLKTGLRRA
jgi:hypothetical protein